MSEKNVELARQLLDAIAQRDLPRLIASTDPEVEWRSFFALPAGWMFKFRNGKVVCFRAFREPEQALEAVGLPG